MIHFDDDWIIIITLWISAFVCMYAQTPELFDIF